ncbi:MAG: DapH/DapD/GlmU-related protein, partial [Streptosporangiaceae bacterium]
MTWKHDLARRRRVLVAAAVQGAWRRLQQAGTVTAETAAGRRFAAFGPCSMMAFPTGAVYGERWIEVGDMCMIAELVTLCAGMAPGHDLGPDPVLRIGDRCVIGRGSNIIAHHSLEIGDDVFTGPYVYITDQNHQYEDIDTPIGRQWPVNSPVRIGSGSWLGTGSVILPGAVIGKNVVVASGSV